MDCDERAVQFTCGGDGLVGILHQPRVAATRGVLVVVGGPQYRAGSHRQFTLLARSLAAEGIPVLRFDYRGMGDSEGAPRGFEAVGDDLRAAIDCFTTQMPQLRDLVLWGLCDGAAAALLYAAGDRRVAGLALLNPWVRSDEGFARTTLRHYYRKRLLQAELWRKLLSGRFDYRAAARAFGQLVKASRGAPAGGDAGRATHTGHAADATVDRDARYGGHTGDAGDGGQAGAPAGAGAPTAALPDLRQRLLSGLTRFQGKVLFITSGNDLTAKEFLDMVASSKQWQQLLASSRVRWHQLAQADHTFSRALWRDQVAQLTGAWVRSW